MRKSLKFIVLSLLLSFGTAFSAHALQIWHLQRSNVKDKEINIEAKKESLANVFKRLEKQTDYKILFVTDEVKNQTFTGKIHTRDIREALGQILSGKYLGYTINKQFVTVSKQNHPFRGETPVVQEGEAYTLTGKVVDENGVALPGVSIVIAGTRRGASSDYDGHYALKVHKNDILTFTFIGYKEEVVAVKGKEKINVNMRPEAEKLDEVVVVAYGEQKKESVVGAVTTVKAMDLKTSNSDFTAGFAGKIAGIIGWQTGGMPAALTEEEMNTKFYIRGMTSFQTNANTDPLILLDGVETSKLDLSRLQPEDIESFSVMKDASATAMYGARGANGVILVTTKKGQEGSVYTSTRYECIVSSPTSNIDVVDPIDYMKYYNQALLARSDLATPKYSVETINRTASGKYPSWVYPQNDWYDILFKKQSINHHAGINIRGGSKVVQYYASVNYNRDEGMIKTDKLNAFDCNILNHQIGYRTNLNIQLNSGIKLVINSSATLDKYHGPIPEQTAAYAYAFNASPVDFAPTYPGDETYAWPHLRFGIKSVGSRQSINPYAQLQKGYKERTRYSTINRAEYIQNLSKYIKGLEFRAIASLVQSGLSTTPYTTKPYHYWLKNYDFETGKHTLVPDGDNESARSTLAVDVYNMAFTSDTRTTYEGRLYHTAAWGDHQTALTGVFQMYERSFTPTSTDVLNSMKQRNLSYSARASYGYKDRYFVEASGAYNGSERFAENNRMGFFPAVGASWVASSEPWMKPLAKIIPYLKFRLSWGKVGNDGVIDTPRYVYLPQILTVNDQSLSGVIPGSSYTIGNLKPNVWIPSFGRTVVSAYANENIQWEIAEDYNFGIDTKLFKGLVEIQADFYRSIRHNIISNRLFIPASMGIEVAPLDNIGETLSRGVDLSLKLQHQFSEDLWMILSGTLTYNKVTYRKIEQPVGHPEWQDKIGKEISQALGYIAEGLFKDQAEIDNSPFQGGDVMPGDIKYRDLNGDGVIDVNDVTFIGYPQDPRLIYGFQGFLNWKNIEFNFAFQGSGKRTFFIDPVKISPFVNDHAMLQAIADSHWSIDNQDTHAFWPRLSTYSIEQHNPYEDWYNENNAGTYKSTYFMRECRFLRCTNLSIAYNLPKKLLRKWGMQTIKLSLNAYNPFCLTNFKLWDVELGENGFNYPIQKTYSIGLTVNF